MIQLIFRQIQVLKVLFAGQNYVSHHLAERFRVHVSLGDIQVAQRVFLLENVRELVHHHVVLYRNLRNLQFLDVLFLSQRDALE